MSHWTSGLSGTINHVLINTVKHSINNTVNTSIKHELHNVGCSRGVDNRRRRFPW